jgi:hypothetical protein
LTSPYSSLFIIHSSLLCFASILSRLGIGFAFLLRTSAIRKQAFMALGLASVVSSKLGSALAAPESHYSFFHLDSKADIIGAALIK